MNKEEFEKGVDEVNEMGDSAYRTAELDNCSFVKTVLMLIVVFYHSIIFWGATWFTPVATAKIPEIEILVAWMNSFHIYGFTLVSGYIFYYLKYEKGKYQQFGAFVKNKCLRLIVPYAFAAVIWAIPIHWIFYRDTASQYAIKFALGISPSQLWFLLMLFGVFVLCWLLSDFFANYDKLGFCVSVFLCGVGMVGNAIVPNVFQIWTACRYVIYFWLGFKFRQYGTARIRRVPVLWFIIHIALFAIAEYADSRDQSGLLIKLFSRGMDLLVSGVGAVMAFVVLQSVAECIKWKSCGLIRTLERYSMPIYLFHQQVVYFLIAGLNGSIPFYMHSFVNFIGALLFSAAISWILMRCKITRALIGEK